MTETFAEPTLALERPDRPPLTAGRVFRAILRAPFEARTWKELAYLVVALVLGGLAIMWLFGGFGAGLYSSIILLGIPLLALVLLAGRIWGRVYRAVGSALLDTPMPAPPAFTPRPGLLGWLRSAFTDRTSWRALVFLIAEAVLGLFGGYVVLTIVAMTVFTAISPIPWVVFHPINVDDQGREHHSLAQFGTFYVDTWPRVLAMAAVGVLGCLALPWLVRGVCWLHRQLSLALLTPTARDRRLVELQESRRVAVQDSAATLRRLERDLHDGTQARLVTIAMALGRAEERLAAGGDPGDLIADAHASSKEALAELRELVRGIHPPALELGLEPALETLTARCAVPVELRVELPQRPNPAIEAIAYFTVAELLTNVVKHAGATRAWVSVLPFGAHNIAVGVRDDGHGGVRQPVAPDGDTAVSGGLAGLAARARAVDGTLTVDSPAGGPTVVTVTLPVEGPR
ncbi:sensor histidine kinase [Nocardia blacklockiae]|uniref:sensor histidine kinase n=1 Tax=Nocardia blacklockiae TaxID=480036 RepID=UPI001895D903|nr:sensor histidine kinase [Nocardia blacklockiae]MBF6175470.1 sensor domain-containing protein [Nocardia blacklockiae]